MDGIGFVPGIGILADLTNAGIYLLEGRWAEAGFSAFAAIPGIGYLAAGAQGGKYTFAAARWSNKLVSAATHFHDAQKLYRLSRAVDVGINLTESAFYGIDGLRTGNNLQIGMSVFGLAVNGASIARNMAKASSRTGNIISRMRRPDDLQFNFSRQRHLPVLNNPACFVAGTGVLIDTKAPLLAATGSVALDYSPATASHAGEMPWRITRNQTAGLLIVTGGMIVAVAEWRRRQRRKAEEELRRLPPSDRVFHASETWPSDEIEWASVGHADGTEASKVDDVFLEFADEDLVAV